MFVDWLISVYRKVRERKGLSISFVSLVLLACVLGNATCFYIYDGAVKPDLAYGDALWYSLVSITTIGYGDFSATSLGARLGTLVFIMVAGLSTFTIFLGMLVDWVAEVIVKGQLGMNRIFTNNHVLLVNFPGEPRIRQLIDELRSDPIHEKKDIVVVTDRIEKLPFSMERLSFVRGSPLQRDSYERAQVEKASMAVVLATGYSDANSDAIVASAVSVINEINSSIHIVAECLDENHRMLFNSVRCNAIVPSLRIIGNLLAQEISDPGVVRMMDVITSNLKGDTLFSTEVTEDVPDTTFTELAKRLLDRDINLLCVNRAEESHTQFQSLRPLKGDTVIYVAHHRMAWQELIAQRT